MSDVEMIETEDVQGLVVRGYGTFVAARFLVFAIENPERAREYLRGLCGRINLASVSPESFALQVAFTHRALAKLGVPERALVTFSREFSEGMDDDIRADSIGDRDANDPRTWQWGKRDEPVHVLLMVYARDEDTLQAQLASELASIGDGMRLLHEKHTTTLADQKEHFGWRDGLSMPKIAGIASERPRKKRETWTSAIPAGEFLLGYRSDDGADTESPTVEIHDDPANHLAFAPDGVRKNLGRNGTYLVFREMSQDVPAFWRYLREKSREPGDDPAIALGAKMVGRWPGGAPLITSPDEDAPESATENHFFYNDDRAGLRCPHGAHIRRANPRDVLAVEDRGTDASLQMVRKHQMVRRGRAFGRPVAPSMDPSEIMATPPDNEHRGLHFICLVGDINRQFEFVQRAWLHSANFDSMFKDGDPISAGRRAPGSENPNDEFTCPAEPVRRKYKAMPQFTRLVGGAYFFLPGLAALRFIARSPAGGT